MICFVFFGRVKELTQELDDLAKDKKDKDKAADPRQSARMEIEASLGNIPCQL